MRVKIKNLIYLFFATLLVAIASISTNSYASEQGITTQLIGCQFADEPINCQLTDSNLQVNSINFTEQGQHFDATISFTNSGDADMKASDDSVQLENSNIVREIVTPDDFSGILKPGESVQVIFRLTYTTATTDTLNLSDDLGFNLSFSPIETTTTETVTEVVKGEELEVTGEPESVGEQSAEESQNPKTFDSVLPFAIFSGSCLVLAFILRKKANTRCLLIAFLIGGTALIPFTEADALSKFTFSLKLVDITGENLVISINKPVEELPEESLEPEAAQEEPTREPEAVPETTEPETTQEAQPETAELPTRSASTSEPEEKIEPTTEPTEEAEKEPTQEQEPEQEPAIKEPEPISKEAQSATEQNKANIEEAQPTTEPTETIAEEVQTEPEQQPEATQEEEPGEEAEQAGQESAPELSAIESATPQQTEIQIEEKPAEQKPTAEEPQALYKGGYKYANICPGSKDSQFDDWGFYICECVSYSANRVFNNLGFFPNWRGRGNANQWIANARNEGYVVSDTPKVGAIGVNLSGRYGHTVYVEKVEGNRVYISQYNARIAATNYIAGEYSEVWDNASNYQYIYFDQHQ